MTTTPTFLMETDLVHRRSSEREDMCFYTFECFKMKEIFCFMTVFLSPG